MEVEAAAVEVEEGLGALERTFGRIRRMILRRMLRGRSASRVFITSSSSRGFIIRILNILSSIRILSSNHSSSSINHSSILNKGIERRCMLLRVILPFLPVLFLFPVLLALDLVTVLDLRPKRYLIGLGDRVCLLR